MNINFYKQTHPFNLMKVNQRFLFLKPGTGKQASILQEGTVE